jgi:hypothetical protein
MPTISLSIEADLCGPISVGTVGVVRALMAHLELSLTESLAIVERCVFDGECREITAPSQVVAEALLATLQRTAAAPRIRASITSRTPPQA